jgi:ABC-type nickel/cobalt efflux system permease component RcnA
MPALLRIGGIAIILVAAALAPATAHPLGNFTLNHLTRISAAHDGLRLRYVLDMAEIPAFALDRSLDPRGAPSDATLRTWARGHAAEVARQLALTVDGRDVSLTTTASTVERRPGAGGLPTLYFSALYAARVAPGAHRIVFVDSTAAGRLGWKDVVVGDTAEPTHALRAYPNALAGSPRDRTSIVASVDAAGRIVAVANADAAAAAPATAALGRSNALSDVLAKGAGDPLVVLAALLLAIALGALHALEPGHGKTLLAVSLVGARATPRQALILASALTVAHTAGVLALGVVVLLAAQWIVPEQIYPWITLGSGTFVAILGARAVAREVRSRLPLRHAHAHAHPHAHPHAHDHVHALGDADHHDDLDEAAHAQAHAIAGTAPLTFRSAVLAAASGNIAPCPAALVVLLAAIGIHQIGYGLALIVAFSIGLAAVLTVLGVAVVRSAAWLVARPRFDRVARFAPLVTSVVIATVGAVMIGQGFAAQGIGVPVPLVAALVLAAVAGYAFAWHRHPASSEAHA